MKNIRFNIIGTFGVAVSLFATVVTSAFGAAPIRIEWNSAAQSISESGGNALVGVSLRKASAVPITVNYSVGGTAVAGTDFTAPAGSFVIPAGALSGSVMIPILDNAVAQPNRTLILTLTSIVNASLGRKVTHTVTIQDNDAPVPSAQFNAAASTVAENVGLASLTVNLSTATTVSVTIPYTLAGTAVAGSDYVAPAGTLTIPAGSTSGQIAIAITDDVIDENDETIIVTLGAPTGATLGALATSTLTITDNDNAPLPVAQLSVAAQSALEGTATVTVTLNLSAAATEAVSVPFTVAGTAATPLDFAFGASSFAIAVGATTATVDVTLVDDVLDENNETIIMTLGTPSGATLGAVKAQTITIQDNDAPPTIQWNMAAQSVAENVGNVTLVANLSAVSGLPVTANYAFTGTAVEGTDYTGANGTITIAAGAMSASKVIPVINNAFDQVDRTLIATLSGPVNATLGATVVHTVTITDDDPTPSIQFSALAQTVTEAVGTVSVTALLSAASGKVITVPYTISGTALNPGDHNLVEGTLTVPAQATSAAITFTVVNDTVTEVSETVVLTLGAPANAIAGTNKVHTVTITDDDAAIPTAQLAAATLSVAENVGSVSLAVNLSAATTAAVTVPYTVSGTATNPQDHNLAASGSLSIAAGATSGNITFAVTDDLLDENDETIIVTLGTPTGATLGATKVETVTITDNDLAPTIAWSAAAQTVSENIGSVSVTAALSAATSKAVTVPYTVSGTATNPADHGAANGTLTIPAGQTSTTISFNVAADAVTEANETVILTLGAPTNATAGATLVHTVTISDAAPATITIGWAATVQSASEGSTVNLRATLNAPSATAITAPVMLSGTATAGTDYLVSPASLTIPAGSTSANVLISLVSDLTVEPSETATLTLGAPSGGAGLRAGASAFALTLTDNSALPHLSFQMNGDIYAKEGDLLSFVVELSAPSAMPVTVPYTIGSLQNVTAGVDILVPLTGTFTIPAGSRTLNFPIQLVENATLQQSPGRGSLQMNLGLPQGALPGTRTSLRAIIVDDERAFLTPQPISRTLHEGSGDVVLTAKLDKPLPGTVPVTLTFNTQNPGDGLTPGVDFTFVNPTLDTDGNPAFTFQPGSTQASLTIRLTDDAVVEPTEYFSYSVFINQNTPISSAQGTYSFAEYFNFAVTDNDAAPIVVSWANASGYSYENLSESAGTVPLTVRLNKPTNVAVTVPITIDTGRTTVVSGVEYIFNTTSVTIPAGSTAMTFNLELIDDTTFRGSGNHALVLVLGTPTGAVLGAEPRSTFSIVDDDPVPVLQFASSAKEYPESAGASTVAIVLDRLSALNMTGRLGLGNDSSARTATANVDFTYNSTFAIPAGTTSGNYQMMTITEDAIAEDTERFNLELANFATAGTTFLNLAETGANNVHQVSILDNDTPPAIQWTLASQTVNEGAGKAIVTASIPVATTKIVHVPFTIGGNAEFGADHKLFASEVIIPIGATTGTVEFPIVTDATVEADETVILTLQAGAGNPIGTNATHTVTIHDTGLAPSLAAYEATVYKLVRASACVACHVPGGPAAFAPFASPDLAEAFAAAVPRANFADIPQSQLVTKLAAGHQGQGAVKDPMIVAITEWRDGSGANPNPTPTASVVPLLAGTAGLQDYQQFEASLSNATGGFTHPGYSLTGTYDISLANTSTSGNPLELSAGMVGGYLGVAAEYCRLMILEISAVNGTYSKRGFDLITGLNSFQITNTAFTPTIQAQVAQRLSQLFLLRNATAAEVTDLQTLVTELLALNPNTSTPNLGIGMCTAVAGSLDSIDN